MSHKLPLQAFYSGYMNKIAGKDDKPSLLGDAAIAGTGALAASGGKVLSDDLVARGALKNVNADLAALKPVAPILQEHVNNYDNYTKSVSEYFKNVKGVHDIDKTLKLREPVNAARDAARASKYKALAHLLGSSEALAKWGTRGVYALPAVLAAGLIGKRHMDSK